MAVTGVGVVSPLGNDLPSNMENLINMDVPLQDARIKDDPIASPLMKLEKIFHCNYDDVNIDDLIDDKEMRYSDPICKTSMIAVDEAIRMSGIKKVTRTNTSVCWKYTRRLFIRTRLGYRSNQRQKKDTP